MELDKKVLTSLRTNHWPGLAADNPIVYEKGHAYVRHNQIQIGNAGDASGGVIVRFLWNHQPVAWVRFYGAKRATDKFESVDVPEGRHKVESGTAQQEG